MNCFLAVHYKSTAHKNEIYSRIIRKGLQTIPFIGSQVVLWDYEQFQTTFLTVTIWDALFQGQHTWSGEQAFFNFSGIPMLPGRFFKSDNFGSVPEKIASTLQQEGLQTFYRKVIGTYNAIALQPEGLIYAFSDFSGRYPVFYVETPEIIAVSNRQSLLYNIAFDHVTPSLNFQALSLLLAHGNIWLDQSVFQGVRLIEPGTYLCLDTRSGRALQSDFAWQLWHRFDNEAELKPYHFDKAAEKMDETYQAIKDCPLSEIELLVSGGKDSRICLGFVVRNGLKGRVRALTSGYAGSPELDCAGEMTSHCGIPHQRKITERSRFEKSRYWKCLRFHLGRNDASLTPTVGLTEPIIGGKNPVRMGGFGGELYRKSESTQFRTDPIRSLQDAKMRWRDYHVPADCLNVIRPEVNEQHARWMADWVQQAFDRGVPLKAMPEVFWVKFRYPFHHGIFLSSVSFDLRFDPMYHQDVVNIHLQGPYEMGMMQRMHFELLKRADRWLAEFPFVNDGWDPRLAPYAVDLNLASAPYAGKIASEERNLRPQAWEFYKEAKGEIESLFFDHPESGIFNIVDRAKLETWFKTTQEIQALHLLNQFMALVSIQLLLTGNLLRGKDKNLESGEPQFITNSKNISLVTGESDQWLELAST